jgi:hypothetical protein
MKRLLNYLELRKLRIYNEIETVKYMLYNHPEEEKEVRQIIDVYNARIDEVTFIIEQIKKILVDNDSPEREDEIEKFVSVLVENIPNSKLNSKVYIMDVAKEYDTLEDYIREQIRKLFDLNMRRGEDL